MLTGLIMQLFLFCIDEPQLLGFLSNRDKCILKAIISGKTLGEVSAELNLSRERIRQLLKKATTKISHVIFHNFKNIIQEYTDLKQRCYELRLRNKILEKTILSMNIPLPPTTDNIDKSTIDKYTTIMRQKLETKITEVALPIRVLNCLRKAEIETLADLVSSNRKHLLKFQNFGRKSLATLEYFMQNEGLYWGMDVTKYGLLPKWK
jgi:DNA-binding CsgD family transcriptional regulator